MKKLITFEGIDGSGKTSIIKKIIPMLESDYKLYYSYEPNNMFGHFAKYGCPGLEMKDNIYLWWLSRRFEQNKSEYKSADIVLKDRYYDSSYVYQQLYKWKNLYEVTYDENYFDKPDLTFILKLDLSVALERCKIRKDYQDQYETDYLNTLKNRQDHYLELPNIFDDRKFIIIDTNKTCLNDTVQMCIKEINGDVKI